MSLHIKQSPYGRAIQDIFQCSTYEEFLNKRNMQFTSKNPPYCPECKRKMNLNALRWNCPSCQTHLPLHHPMPFPKSKLFWKQNLLLLAFFAADKSIQDCENELAISHPTVCHWYSIFREKVAEKMRKEMQEFTLKEHVMIDESLFGKSKYNRGRCGSPVWVFGICEAEKSGKVYMTSVEKRNEDTLIPIILSWVDEGTIVCSDMWKGYQNLEDNGFNHETVNHSESFVNPESGAHTQRIESLWSACKRWLRKHNYKHHDYLESYILEWCYRYNHKKNFEDLFDHLFF